MFSSFLFSFLAAANPADSTHEQLDVRPPAGGWLDYRRVAAFEVNVMWPLFPGGIVDLAVVTPLARRDRSTFRGELITGLHSDFGWRSVRESDAGNVAFLAAKLGWRQFLAWGLHVDAVVNLGWRHQENNPWDGETIHAFQGRLWAFGGYQHEFTRRFYASARGGLGVHLFRTDRFASRTGNRVAPAADVYIGFRFR